MQQTFIERRRAQVPISFKDRRGPGRSIVGDSTGTIPKKEDRTGVNLPVVIDFLGRISRGVCTRFAPGHAILLSETTAVSGSMVTVQLCFKRKCVPKALTGQVISVEEESAAAGRFLLHVRFPQSKKDDLDPQELLSLSVSDNPHLPKYRRDPSKDRKPSASGRAPEARPGEGPCSPPPSIGRIFIQGVQLSLQLVRDLLVRLLPRPLSRFLVPEIAYAFITHPRDLSDVSRKALFAKYLGSGSLQTWLRYQWPVVGSYITGFRDGRGKPLRGALLLSPLTAEQMLRNSRLAKKRVYQTVKLAEKMGARVAGLGAFTSIITKDGKDLIGKVATGVTTGNSYSAAVAVQNLVVAAGLTNLSLPLGTAAVVGGAGSLGSACAALLARLVDRLILVDIDEEGLKRLAGQIERAPLQLERTSRVEAVKKADAIIVATSSPFTLIQSEHLKPGAIVIDAAQPNNVSEGVSHRRRDILVIESAIVQVPGVECELNVGLGPGEVYGCLSETMILSRIGHEGRRVLGKADPEEGAALMKAGQELAFRLAYFRNGCGYITEGDLVRVAQARDAPSSYV